MLDNSRDFKAWDQRFLYEKYERCWELNVEWGAIVNVGPVARFDAHCLPADRRMKLRLQNPGARCALYAIAWQSIDECKGKIDVRPTLRPPRAFPSRTNKCLDRNLVPGRSFRRSE